MKRVLEFGIELKYRKKQTNKDDFPLTPAPLPLAGEGSIKTSCDGFRGLNLEPGT